MRDAPDASPTTEGYQDTKTLLDHILHTLDFCMVRTRTDVGRTAMMEQQELRQIDRYSMAEIYQGKQIRCWLGMGPCGMLLTRLCLPPQG